MTSIEGRLFTDCYSLTQITLPKKIVSVDEHAFVNCVVLKSIKSKALYPPVITKDGYPGRKLRYTGKLIVPVGSKDSYAKHSGWGHCNPIVEED